MNTAMNTVVKEYYATENTIFVLDVNGKTFNAAGDHRNFEMIRDRLLDGFYTSTNQLEEDFTPVKLNIGHNIVLEENYLMVRMENGETIYLNGELFRRLREGTEPPEHIVAFLKRARKNSRPEAVTELYDWLQVSKMPIDVNGYFYAYKRVTYNFRDIRTATFDNSPDSYVSMPEEDVDPDRNRTCSTGLHFAAWDYLDSYSSASMSRTVLLKIDPADVVAIPNDYNNMKGRTSRYYVVAEVPGAREPDYGELQQHIPDDYEDDEDYEDYEDDC